MNTKKSIDNAVVKRISSSRKLKEQDYKDMRKTFGHKMVQENEKYVIVAFDDYHDYLAFVVAIGKSTGQINNMFYENIVK